MANASDRIHRPSTGDWIAAAVVLAFSALISVFPIRDYDVWWMMAVGRRILETRSFITTDPFTFTVAGTPWAPQSYLGAILFYGLYKAAGAWGLIALRMVLVVAIAGVTLRTLARVGTSWLLASPVVLVVLLNAHSRFDLRAHLFEYLFVALLVWFLLTAHERKGRSFFVLPLVLQVLWVNTHPSFPLGPVLTGLFFAAERAAGKLERSMPFLRPLHARRDWRRVWLLLGLMVVACLANPAPQLFLTQPFGTEQRELLSRFTLEWKSPFDPALRHGALHPYYEILLALSALAIVSAIARLPLAPALLIVATALPSLQSHRFRVEFALVSLPMMFVLFQSTPVVRSLAGRVVRGARAPVVWGVVAAVVAAGVLAAGADRVEVGGPVAERYPDEAFEFIQRENIARRPFHTIGFGSYLLWDLYGVRSSFIDGRNFNAPLYRDFLTCQTNEPGRRQVTGKYDLDAFILPPVETSDAGMRNIHASLVRDTAWSLAHLDRVAWVYVRNDAVEGPWLAANAYRVYHPLTLTARSRSPEEMDSLTAELERATSAASDYAQTWFHLGLVRNARGEPVPALAALERAHALEPGDLAVLSQIGQTALAAGEPARAVAACEELARLDPDRAASWVYLARAYAGAGDRARAQQALSRALAIDPQNKAALDLRGRLR